MLTANFALLWSALCSLKLFLELSNYDSEMLLVGTLYMDMQEMDGIVAGSYGNEGSKANQC